MLGGRIIMADALHWVAAVRVGFTTESMQSTTANAQKVEILELLGRKVSHVVRADRCCCGPRTVSRIAENRVSSSKLVASASA